jgi:hypothetical protein
LFNELPWPEGQGQRTLLIIRALAQNIKIIITFGVGSIFKFSNLQIKIMQELRIIGLLITDRIKEAGLTQKVLSENAHIIKSRLGFHEVSEDICSRVGVILLQLRGKVADCDKLEKELREIGGIEVQKMSFQF